MSSSPHARPDAGLVVSLALASLSGGLFLPLSLVYFTVLTDLALPVLGAIVSGSVLVGLPLPLLAGLLVDRLGARNVVASGLILQAAAYAGYVVVRELLPVFAASAVMAVGVRLFWASVFTLLAEHAETGSSLSVEMWFGRLNAARTVGIVAGGVVTGAAISLALPGAYVAIAAAAAVCEAVAAVLIVVVVRSSRRPRTLGNHVAGHGGLIHDRAFLLLLLCNSVFALCIIFVGLTLPTLVRSGLEAPGWLSSGLLVTNALLVAVFSARGAATAKREPQVRVLTRAGFLWCGAFGVVAAAANLHWLAAAGLLLLGVALMSGAEVLHAPASAALVNTMAGRARSRYLAVFQYSFVFAEITGPVLFTTLFGVEPALPFLVVGAASLAAAVALRSSRRRSTRTTTALPG